MTSNSGGAPSNAYINQVNETAAWLAQRLLPVKTGNTLVIAGSGLGGFVRSVEVAQSFSYAEIPHVGASTVAGHAGTLVIGRLNSGTPVTLLNGRRHLYEGISAQQSTLLLRALLVAVPCYQQVIISNAAGGLNAKFEVGDLMLLSDHVNMMFQNPLIGPNNPEWGPRFPDMSEPYAVDLRQLAHAVAADQGFSLREGTYVANLGPSYETRAEVSMLRDFVGADAVGMSTVPEVIVARHAGRKVLGISFISNMLTRPVVTSHEEVMENASLVERRFSALVTGVIQRLEGKPSV